MLVVGDELERSQWVLPDPKFVSLSASNSWRMPFLGVRYCPDFSKKINQLHSLKQLNIIHDNGLWLPSNYASARSAKVLNIPHIISPHGMLEPWALKHRGWKKKLVWWAWQKAAIQKAAVLHATAVKEAENLRALGLTNPITVIPNGVNMPERCAPHTDESERVVLFLSRIHPVKGILNLIIAWARLQPIGWKLVIAGPDQDGHQAEIQKIIDTSSIGKQVQFIGVVDDKTKWQLYEQASLFVLPSLSENFGIVVAEALAAGLPVITTKGAPWLDLVTYDCGWWVNIGVEPLVSAMREAMALSNVDRLEMGKKGRQLVQNSYAWPKIAEDMKNTYRWMLEGGTPPNCVRLD